MRASSTTLVYVQGTIELIWLNTPSPLSTFAGSKGRYVGITAGFLVQDLFDGLPFGFGDDVMPGVKI